MGDEAVEWEYMVTTLYANAAEQQDFLERTWPDKTFARYAPEALTPVLNTIGAEGWELVSAQPVIYGVNGDVLISNAGQGANRWSRIYQCFFKRRKSAS